MKCLLELIGRPTLLSMDFRLFILHTGTCITFFLVVVSFFWKAFEFRMTLPHFQSSHTVPYCWAPTWTLLGQLCPFHDVSPHVTVAVGHHPWFRTREGIVLSCKFPSFQVCLGLVIWTQIFSFPITQKLIWLSSIFCISHNSLLTAQPQYLSLVVLIIIYPLFSL